ncbi:hypothetical protein AVEN_8387-1 [Araneus ventricosus]|uniref:Mos1 transposase HTH domain-containing protein n=1 Tax=Araneus ventricosus TaxID=182803 RepID=A0A4Y2KG77_ARAVE|nr:hypothetical protein AVEN_8387-1 [Araneus ventricosus]
MQDFVITRTDSDRQTVVVITSSNVEEKRAVIRFLFAKGKKVGEIYSEMVEVYVKDCITVPMWENGVNVSRWANEFGRRNPMWEASNFFSLLNC